LLIIQISGEIDMAARRSQRKLIAAGVAGTLGSFLVQQRAEAHEKWFHNAHPFPTTWESAFKMPGIAAVAVAIGLTVLTFFLWRMRRGIEILPGPEQFGATLEGRKRFYGIVPFILGLHVALPLIVLGIQGNLFSPNNGLQGAWRYWLGAGQIGVGLGFLYGGVTRLSAMLLALFWICGIFLVGLEPMFENFHYLGIAAFFFFAGRGPHAIDRMLFPVWEPSVSQARLAMPCLRIGMGLSLSVVAFTEKLANPQLAKSFLEHYPLNFTKWMGIPMSDELFVLCAGATELIIGLCLIFGLFPRVIIVTAWLFINMTLTVFNWVELLGHLPLYGIMAILLVWTPQEEDQRLWTQGVLGKSTTPQD
jgi:uncharacterized membrane protein YphA (DoxX/SURF4 family)